MSKGLPQAVYINRLWKPGRYSVFMWNSGIGISFNIALLPKATRCKYLDKINIAQAKKRLIVAISEDVYYQYVSFGPRRWPSQHKYEYLNTRTLSDLKVAHTVHFS